MKFSGRKFCILNLNGFDRKRLRIGNTPDRYVRADSPSTARKIASRADQARELL